MKVCRYQERKSGWKKAREFYVDKNNTASMESRETFIQFQQKNNE
jgi:hypothetical protein